MSQISQKYRKDYKNAKFDNPRILKKKEDKALRSRKLVFIFGGALLIGILYLLFFSPVFMIRSIEVSGLSKVKPENINRIIDQYRSERKFLVIPKNNILIFSKKELLGLINREYYFDDLQIKKKFNISIQIVLKEKQPAITWMSNNICYNLDDMGLAIEYCDSVGSTMKIYDMENIGRSIGDHVLSGDEAKLLLDVDRKVMDIARNKFEVAIYEKNKNILTIKTNSLLEIRLDIASGVGEQLERLMLLSNRKDVADSLKQLQYIDLRFGEKIYLK